MRRQLDRLIELAARDHITVEVLPFGAGAYPALNGSFVIFGFPGAADADVLYQEGPEGDEVIHTGRPREIFPLRTSSHFVS